MTSLGTVALMAALTVGQTDSPSEHLKALQPLIGQWVYVGPAQSDSPGIGPKGTEFIAVMTYTWAINKNALRIQWVGKSADRKPVQFVELIGWDGKQKKLVSQGFGSLGAVEHNVWTREKAVVICNTKGVDDEGQEVSLRYLHKFSGDTMTFELVDTTVEGEEKPDVEFKYRRVR
jgi:hypothetical protein